jgi:hypothetical protein
MKTKFAFALAGLLAISSATFAADGRDHRERGDDHRGGYHENYRDHDRGYHDRGDYDRGHYRDYGYGGGGAYLGVAPGYYSGYVAPQPYVDPYAYTAPAPYPDAYSAPYDDEYVGPAPFAGAIWIGGNWGYGSHGRYWVRGHWGHRR